MTLDWQPKRLRINWRRLRTVSGQVARASDGSWYVAWKAEDGWSIGQTDDLAEPIQVQPVHWRLPERSDTELIASAWAVGLEHRLVKRHLGYDVFTDDEEGLGPVSWKCRTCDVGGVNEPNARIAAARARGHWRHELGVAIDLASR